MNYCSNDGGQVVPRGSRSYQTLHGQVAWGGGRGWKAEPHSKQHHGWRRREGEMGGVDESKKHIANRAARFQFDYEYD